MKVEKLSGNLLSTRIGRKFFEDISHTEMLKVVRAAKYKKYNFLKFAAEVEEIKNDRYNVYIEYIY